MLPHRPRRFRTAPRAFSRAMVGLEALPRWARTEVVQFAANHRALPLLSRGTLAALKALGLAIGKLEVATVEEAVQQAHAPRRAWDLHTLTLWDVALTDVSGLAGCVALHSLNLSYCRHLTDVSSLGGCAALHTLDLSCCARLTEVSAALAGCATLHTLDLTDCQGLRDVSALSGCAALHTLDLTWCRGLRDASALAGCATLHTLDLTCCRGAMDVSALSGLADLRRP